MKKLNTYIYMMILSFPLFASNAYAQVSTGPKNNSRATTEEKRVSIRTGRPDADAAYSASERSTGRSGRANIGRVKRSDISYSRERTRTSRTTLPSGYERYRNNGKNYYYHDGRYYTDHNGRYVSTSPYTGLRVKRLPAGNSRIAVSRNVYYYYYGTFYTLNRGFYEVVHPPIGTVVNSIPPDSERIYLYGHLYHEFNGIIYIKTGRRYQVAGFVSY